LFDSLDRGVEEVEGREGGRGGGGGEKEVYNDNLLRRRENRRSLSRNMSSVSGRILAFFSL